MSNVDDIHRFMGQVAKGFIAYGDALNARIQPLVQAANDAGEAMNATWTAALLREHPDAITDKQGRPI